MPQKAKPYFRMRSPGIPRATRAASYSFSSIWRSASRTVSDSSYSSFHSQNQTYTPESLSPSDSRWQAKGSIPLSRLRSVGHTQSVRLFPSACFPPEQTLEGFLDLRAPFPDQLTHKAVRAGIGPVGAYFLFPRKLMIDQGL